MIMFSPKKKKTSPKHKKKTTRRSPSKKMTGGSWFTSLWTHPPMTHTPMPDPHTYTPYSDTHTTYAPVHHGGKKSAKKSPKKKVSPKNKTHKWFL